MADNEFTISETITAVKKTVDDWAIQYNIKTGEFQALVQYWDSNNNLVDEKQVTATLPVAKQTELKNWLRNQIQ